MKFDTKDLFAAFPHLAKNPSLAIAIFALAVPMVLLYCATKFVDAPVEALVLFGGLGMSALVYAAWVVNQLKGSNDAKSKESANQRALTDKKRVG